MPCQANYTPCFAKLFVTIADQKKLGVKAPGSAEVGASVTFLVIDRSNGQGIAGAALWALRTEDITSTAEPVWQSLVAGFAQNEVIEKYKSLAKGSGILLGYSDDSGQQVTIKAIESNGGQPVEKAAVYAFNPGIIMPPTTQRAPLPVDNGTATAAVIDSSASPVTSA